VHAGTSTGHVYNNWKTGKWPWDIKLFINDTPTIFNLLEEARQSWKIYHGGSLLTCFAYLLQDRIQHYATINPETNHFFQMEQFWIDAAAPRDATGPNSLPRYSFIEPRYFSSLEYGPENDSHPAYLPIDIDGPSNVLQGERLIYDVYQALRRSPNWDQTLLVITFDEHGGCYDHVPPPAAIPPDEVVIPPSVPGGSGFTFNKLGVRVPTVLVSPLIEPGTVCQTVFDHTSIIKTIINCVGLKDGQGNPATLLAREAAAQDLREVLTLSQPRTDTPVINPRPLPVASEPAERLLMGIHKDLLAAAARRLAHLGGELLDLSQIQSIEQASAALDERADSLRKEK
jgi:phospholipase C